MYAQLKADIDQRLDAHSLVEVRQCPKCSNPVTQKSKKRKGGVNVFWVHKNPDHATECGVTFLNDRAGDPELPLPEKTADCPNCSALLTQRSGDHGPYWSHKDGQQVDKCGIRSFPDQDGVPGMREKPVTAPCAKCGDTLTRRYSKKTEKHCWVHTKKKPDCGSFFVDDDEGVPAISMEA